MANTNFLDAATYAKHGVIATDLTNQITSNLNPKPFQIQLAMTTLDVMDMRNVDLSVVPINDGAQPTHFFIAPGTIRDLETCLNGDADHSKFGR